MSNFKESILQANGPKEKAEQIQKMLATITKDSLEEYEFLCALSSGEHGADIKAYAAKCLDYVQKKFPSLKEAVEAEKQKKLDSLVQRKTTNPPTKKCTFCLTEIPFEALKCSHCHEFAPVEEPVHVSNTYPISVIDIFKKAKQLGASDIHLSVGYHPIFRVSGEMVHQKNMPVLKPSDCLSLSYQVLTDDGKRRFETEKEVDQAFDIEGVCRLRLNVAQERKGAALVARILPSKILSMDDLKFKNKPVYIKLCMEINGLIVVTGPTGSGKSTTLAAMMDYINTNRTEHIITVEDPIEFVHMPKKSKIMQRELRTNTKSFYAALRSALRQDPDVMLVGEMRDKETTELALEAAETGHLVFGTLHTNSAAKTIDRIINMFSAEDQSQVRTSLSENLKGIIAQQLIKRVGGGRVAVQEIMLKNTAISNLIREQKTYQINEYIGTAKSMGMQLMDDEIRRFLELGEITREDAYRYALNKVDFALESEEGAKKK
jgi:twitching motility protein PilT